MSYIKLQIQNKEREVLQEVYGQDEVNLVYKREYQEGDRIVLDVEEVNTFYYVQFDDAKGKSLVYLKGNVEYEIPVGEKRINISPKVFIGSEHLLFVRKAMPKEVGNYRNLSENLWDQHGEVNCYPHASANVETRGESVFAAMNAIDGVTVSESHGAWPYESWGINKDPNAEMRIDFGRKVKVDLLKVYLRADFPHDSWWTSGVVTFSDGSIEVLEFVKSGEAQTFRVTSRECEWLTFSKLIKAEDESPFPALTQFEVYGKEIE